MKNKILITGSTGFVGRHLTPVLTNNGFEVLEITRSKNKSIELFGDTTSKVEVNDFKFEQKIIDFNPEIIIHLASYLTSSDEFEDVRKLIDTNIIFFSKILNVTKKIKLKLFINTGTFAEYSSEKNQKFNPAYLYSASKTASRSFLNYYSKTYDFKEFTVVPYTIYGGKDSQKKIIDYLLESKNSKKAIDLSPGNQKLDFIHINDIVDLYIHLIKNQKTIPDRQNIFAGTGVGTTLKDLATLISNHTENKLNLNWGRKQYRKNDVMDATAPVGLNNFIPKWNVKITLKAGLKKYLTKNIKL
jgi:nucleoside-diphosphate-sugar epimerase